MPLCVLLLDAVMHMGYVFLSSKVLSPPLSCLISLVVVLASSRLVVFSWEREMSYFATCDVRAWYLSDVFMILWLDCESSFVMAWWYIWFATHGLIMVLLGIYNPWLCSSVMIWLRYGYQWYTWCMRRPELWYPCMRCAGVQCLGERS